VEGRGRGGEAKRTSERSPSSKFAITPLMTTVMKIILSWSSPLSLSSLSSATAVGVRGVTVNSVVVGYNICWQI